MHDGEDVLDAGCGAGAAALCLAARIAECTVTGVDLDDKAAGLARRNAKANGVAERFKIVTASLTTFANTHAGQFDHVITNPPFHEQGRHTPSPHAGKSAAHGEETLDLAAWISACAVALKPGGTLTLIHRADRLDAILAAFKGRFGAAKVFPLWPRAGQETKRIVVSARKGRRTAPRLLSGLVLHEADGRYTAAADAILRDAMPLDLA